MPGYFAELIHFSSLKWGTTCLIIFLVFENQMALFSQPFWYFEK